MTEYPNTEDKDNWSVFLFDCPTSEVGKLIVLLFNSVRDTLPNSLPNFTMRLWAISSVKISFRVLRNKNDLKVVQQLESSISQLLKREGLDVIVNPIGEDAEISGWSKAPLPKCKAYHRLSDFAVRLAEENLFSPNVRNEMRHLAINMLFMREATEHPEKYVPFVDLISGHVFLQPYPISVKKQSNVP